jgi:polysaccharide biosynthesis/export protein
MLLQISLCRLKRVMWVLGLASAIGAWAQHPADLTAGGAQPASASKVASAEKPGKDDTASRPTDSAGVKYDPLSYHIGIEDDLTISVWHEQDLSMDVVVRPDGMITMPLLNDLKVTGMTTKELQDTLTEKLKQLDFLKEPQVTVIVRQIHSRRVYLVGQVIKPGVYGLNDSKTVLQLLAEAGGPGAYAKLGSIYIIRQQGNVRRRLAFNYKKAITGKNLSDDIVLEPGDMVVLP